VAPVLLKSTCCTQSRNPLQPQIHLLHAEPQPTAAAWIEGELAIVEMESATAQLPLPYYSPLPCSLKHPRVWEEPYPYPDPDPDPDPSRDPYLATSSTLVLGKPTALLISTACHSSSRRLRGEPTVPSTCARMRTVHPIRHQSMCRQKVMPNHIASITALLPQPTPHPTPPHRHNTHTYTLKPP
jgi:hypothetical protein